MHHGVDFVAFVCTFDMIHLVICISSILVTPALDFCTGIEASIEWDASRNCVSLPTHISCSLYGSLRHKIGRVLARTFLANRPCLEACTTNAGTAAREVLQSAC